MVGKVIYMLGNFMWWFTIHPIMCIISSRTDFMHWSKLVRLHFAVNPFMPRENSFYGHAHVLKNLGFSPYACNIEHGVYFADDSERVKSQVSKRQRLLYRVKRIVTMGEHRVHFIQNVLRELKLESSINVLKIGPYILGAKSFLSAAQLNEYKKRLGRTLLVFPLHSIETTRVDYDVQQLLLQIDRVKSQFDTVLISMYWHDLILGRAKPYEDNGYTIVCSGKREDPYFLSRQKNLFQLASAVLSNGVGTHVGYALAMNVPCWLFKTECRYSSKDGNEVRSINMALNNGGRDNFFKLFQIGGEITRRQRSLVKEWWGDSSESLRLQ